MRTIDLAVSETEEKINRNDRSQICLILTMEHLMFMPFKCSHIALRKSLKCFIIDRLFVCLGIFVPLHCQ